MAEYATRPGLESKRLQDKLVQHRVVAGHIGVPEGNATQRFAELPDFRPSIALQMARWQYLKSAREQAGNRPARQVEASTSDRAASVVQCVVATSFDQHRGDNAADQANVESYFALITPEHQSAYQNFTALGMTGASACKAMLSCRVAYFAAYGKARDKLAKGQSVDWGAAGAALISWATAINAAFAAADETTQYTTDYQKEFGKATEWVKFFEAEHLTDREMYKNLLAAQASYLHACEQARQDHQWPSVQGPYHLLRRVVQEVGRRMGDESSPDRADEYSNQRSDSWPSNQLALTKLHAVAATSAHPVQSPMHALAGKARHPDIPTMAWSVVQNHLPSAQRALIEDIYLSWRLGRVMDKRDEVSLRDREKNSNTPGALRSWHVNEQRQLPNISDQQVPAEAQDLDRHYKATGRHPYKPDAEVSAGDGPVGYAEYTGTGIQDDVNNSKIVFDYKTGLMYVTVTHYALWTPSPDETDHKIGDKTAGTGSNSAWFAIDMTI